MVQILFTVFGMGYIYENAQIIDNHGTLLHTTVVTTEIQDNSVLLTSSLNLRKVTAFMVDSAAVEPGTMFKVQDF